MMHFRKVLNGLRDPRKSWAYLLAGDVGVEQLNKERFAAELTVASARTIRSLLSEPKFREFKHEIGLETATGAPGHAAHGELIYAMCRVLHPDVVVETGVASGVSTAYILEALDRNNKGRLYSVDLPVYEDDLSAEVPDYRTRPITFVPLGKEVGWVVPANLRKRWILRLGSSANMLPHILKEAGSVDMFLHDSEHSFKNMMWEFETVWRELSEGGVLLADDVGMNSAFTDFCERAGTSACVIDGRLGGARKRREVMRRKRHPRAQ